jgi:hypothetical protein
VTRRVPTRRLAAIGPLFIVSMALGGGVAACSDPEHSPAPVAEAVAPSSEAVAPSSSAPIAAVAEAPVPIGHMHMPTSDEVSAAWNARPAYVTALPGDWQAAYAYALARPDVLQWLPCYCGCEGMGHGSNLDCFFVRREEEGNHTYDEHASYCDICVETANLASAMLREGATMAEIRSTVDAQFGGRAPGTDTALPPSS